MIRVNQQRLVRQQLPVRFLTVTLLVALLWFIIMFLYVDDLISEQTQGTRRHVTTRGRRAAAATGEAQPGTGGEDLETMLVYDHDTGQRLEVERVEDEYVEVWEHGRWVRATSRAAPVGMATPTAATANMAAVAGNAEPHLGRAVKVLSPYSRIRKRSAKGLTELSVSNVHREDDFILLDEDGAAGREGRVRELLSPLSPLAAGTAASSRRGRVTMATMLPPAAEQRLNAAAPRGSDDFHFAQGNNNNNIYKNHNYKNNKKNNNHNNHNTYSINKAILPTVLLFVNNVSSDDKFSHQVTHTTSSTLDKPLRFPPTSPVVPSMAGPAPPPARPAARRFPRQPPGPPPNSSRLRHGTALVEPRQLPLPRQSGAVRRSSPGVRRSRRREPYRDPPHVNINAKAGARINYVNVISWRSSTGRGQSGKHGKHRFTYHSTHSNHSNNHGNSNNNNNNHNKTRLRWTQMRPLLHNHTASGGLRPAASMRTMAPGWRRGVPSGRQVAVPLGPSLDFDLDLKDGYGRHSFNVSASNAVPLVRALPDTRPRSCLLVPPPLASPVLPLATVVICFHNEAWSTLLRTLHSVLARSPEHLLKEIILVDDFSSHDYLGARLETYISRFSQIQLVRTHKREGLIRARLLGVSYARGDVLVFLDSHCECNRQWLEPLLHAITQDRNKIACPQIDIINPDSLRYEGAPPALHGGFNWRLQFVWKQVPQHQGAPHVSGTQPIRTPTMIGGLFAVNRRYFLDIGAYDPGMDIWGGENLELSFRVWMCGGSIDILPCSRVGHLFRPVIPYGFPPLGARATLHHNAMRVAEVWMDQYRKFYYASQDLPRDRVVLASLVDRHQLRRSLVCHDFGWYLKNVVPEMDVPPLNGQYYGQLRNKNSQLCVHSLEGSLNNTLHMASCQQTIYQQQFAVTTSGEFVHYFRCVYVSGDIPVLRPCEKMSFKWSVTKDGQVVSSASLQGAPLCLDARGLSVVMGTCDVSKTSQLWSFTYRFDINKLNIKY